MDGIPYCMLGGMESQLALFHEDFSWPTMQQRRQPFHGFPLLSKDPILSAFPLEG